MTRLKLAMVVGGAVVLTLVAAAWSAGVPDNRYEERVLVANRPGLAPDALIDPHLINAWGLALRPPGAGGHFWIGNAGNLSTSTFVGDVPGMPLHQDGLKLVYLRGPQISYEDGLANVTGLVYNAASDFAGQPIEFPVAGPATNWSTGSAVRIPASAGAAKFVFVTTDGTINAWRSSTAESMDFAVLVKDYSDHGPDQIRELPRLPAFTGAAMTTAQGGGNRLFVADFQNQMIRVIDGEWRDVTDRVRFERPAGIPGNWSPYNIQWLGGRLYVTFAAIDVHAEEAAFDLAAPGAGKVVAYDANGHIVQEFHDAGRLNSPWGLAIAPSTFGPLAGALLVGNFGDGIIAAFDLKTGAFRDYLRNARGKVIEIDGLWALAFGNGVSLGERDSLYFTAGPNLEQDGIFGRLRHAGAETR